jgi:hypothetical protein
MRWQFSDTCRGSSNVLPMLCLTWWWMMTRVLALYRTAQPTDAPRHTVATHRPMNAAGGDGKGTNMSVLRKIAIVITAIGLAGCASDRQSIDWGKVGRDALIGLAIAQAAGPNSGMGIASNRDYSRTWTQKSSRGRCTFFGTGGSVCSW